MPPMRTRRMSKKEQEQLEHLVEKDMRNSDRIHAMIDFKANLKANGLTLRKSLVKEVVRQCMQCGKDFEIEITHKQGQKPLFCKECALKRRRQQQKMYQRRIRGHKYGC